MAKQRGDVTFVQQSLYYPVTDGAMNTDSYDQFATGYYLSRASMEWFWDAYTPDPAQRSEITASPNQASLEQVTGLPPTLVFVDEADVLRDEGEAYAAKLRRANALDLGPATGLMLSTYIVEVGQPIATILTD
jgi:acetyl esterase